jgi:exoribonuclease II
MGLKMRIRELLEGKKFNDLEFIKQDEEGTGINYDLIEDLAFFMHNDDDVYRRHLFPKVAQCIEGLKAKKQFSPMIFKSAVEESYKNYLKKFPIRQLPTSLDEELCSEVCKKLHDDFRKDYDDGKYKD